MGGHVVVTKFLVNQKSKLFDLDFKLDNEILNFNLQAPGTSLWTVAEFLGSNQNLSNHLPNLGQLHVTKLHGHGVVPLAHEVGVVVHDVVLGQVATDGEHGGDVVHGHLQRGARADGVVVVLLGLRWLANISSHPGLVFDENQVKKIQKRFYFKNPSSWAPLATLLTLNLPFLMVL